MMKSIGTPLLIILIALFFTSCESGEPSSPQTPEVNGAWLLLDYEDEDINVYERVDELEGDRSGFYFGPAGELLYRNSGWCGTPPLTFWNTEGTWSIEASGTLLLSFSQAEWPPDMRLEIVSLSSIELRCRITSVQ